MKLPHIFIPDSFKNYDTQKQLKNGRWVFARGYRWEGLHIFYRLRLAYGVFVGKYDVLKWVED